MNNLGIPFSENALTDCPVNIEHPEANGLISWWLAGLPGSSVGKLVNDLMGNNPATWTGTPASNYVSPSLPQRQGSFGEFKFDGSTGYLNCGVSKSLQPAFTFTAMAWFYSPSVQNNSRILSIVNSSFNTGYSMGCDASEGRWSNQCSGTTAYDVGTMPIGSWHHAAITYDGAYFNLWVDAVNQSKVTKTGAISYTGVIALWIGADPRSGGEQFWSGMIDDVRIYNRAFSQDDLQRTILRSKTGYTDLLNRGTPGVSWFGIASAASRGLFRANPMNGLGCGGSFFADPLAA